MYPGNHALGVLALCAAMLGAGDASAGKQTMNETGIENTVTHCVGRFLIDLPADAEYVGGSYDYAFATIERQPMEQSEFRQEVDKLEAKLKDGKHKSGAPLLLTKATPNENTQILGYWANENRSSAVEISGYRWISGMRYLVHKRANYDKGGKSCVAHGHDDLFASVERGESSNNARLLR